MSLVRSYQNGPDKALKVYSLDRIRSEQDPWKRSTVIMLSTSILRSISTNGIGIPMPSRAMYIVAIVRLRDWPAVPIRENSTHRRPSKRENNCIFIEQ